MKKNLILGALIVVVLGGLGWYAYSHPLPHGQLVPSTHTSVPNGPYVEHAQYYDISANYATSTSLTGSANEAAVDEMYQFVQNTVTQFKKDGNFANLTPQDIQMQFGNGEKYSLQIVYLIAPAPHAVSYVYTIYEDTGGAHGNTYFRTFTFDTTTGAPLALSDVFTGNYLQTLSTLSRQLLPATLGEFADQTFITTGTKPDDTSFQNFFFNGTDFVILFPPYQVAPYAAGPITLRIPISQLQGILKNQYP